MKPDDFEKLVVSIRQAGRIRAGTLEPARMTTLESPRMTSRGGPRGWAAPHPIQAQGVSRDGLEREAHRALRSQERRWTLGHSS